MPISKCPGQDNRNWRSQDVFEAPCPDCGRVLEFWKSEPRRRCVGCGRSVTNPHFDAGCAKWCPYADDCLGHLQGGPPNPAESLCDALIRDMKDVFGADRRRVEHALAVLGYAEKILAREGGDPMVVRAAAVLHDIGIHEAERKYGSAAGRYQETEGPPIALGILHKYQIDESRVDHICRIIANHHSARNIDTLEFRILWDADRLVNIPEECEGKRRAELEEWAAKMFRTRAGRELGEAKLLRD